MDTQKTTAKSSKKPAKKANGTPAVTAATDKPEREPLSSKNVVERFKQRVNRAADSIKTIGKSQRWVKEHDLPDEAVRKALEHLKTVLEAELKGGAGGFDL